MAVDKNMESLIENWNFHVVAANVQMDAGTFFSFILQREMVGKCIAYYFICLYFKLKQM